MRNKEKIKEKAKNAPDTPGVYIFRDGDGKPLYIGKAKSIKKRIVNYFNEDSPKNFHLLKFSRSLDFLTLKNEQEALILEADLIKFHKPKYNVLLKDDKRFPYIRIDFKEKWPYPEIVRRVKKDGAKYFGPYLKPNSLRNTLFLSRKYFRYRSCKGPLPSKECLDFHIGLCSAPCTGKITLPDYRESMNSFAGFLSGGVKKLIKKFETEMAELSLKTEYEKAAEKRDAINHMKNVMFGERAIFNDGRDRDLLGFARRGRKGCFFVMQIREGRLHEAFPVMTDIFQETADDEAIGRFIVDFYRSRQPPMIILTGANVQEKKLLEKWINETHGIRTSIKTPKNQFEKEKIEETSKIALSALVPVKRGVPPLLRDFAVALKLENTPAVIYCFDVSHTKFREIKGSQICFKNAKPNKSMYRQYDIPDGFDDLKAVGFIAEKFSNRVISGDLEKPDLVIVDGGPEQLKSAVSAMKYSGLFVKTISIAKRLESVHFEDGNVMTFPGFSPVLFLLKRIRDESHRFGITAHRKKRTKNLFKSSFLEIPGVGEKTARELRKKFKNKEDIKNRSIKDLVQVKSVSEKKAAAILEFLNREE